MGLGAMMVYIDPLKDYGRGEVCVKDIDPLDVYVDPNCRDRLGDDAENIIISRLFTKEQAKQMYPQYESAIQNAESDLHTDRPTTQRVDDKGIVFPEDTATKTQSTFGSDSEYIRGYERYYKVWVKRFHIKNNVDGTEEVLIQDDMPEYLARPAVKIYGQVITDPKKAEGMIAQITQQYEQMAQKAEMEEEEPPQALSTAEVP